MKNNLSGTIIGLIFSVVSFIGTFTLFIPFLFVLPVVSICENVIGPASYEKIGTTSILVLSVLTVLICTIYYVSVFQMRKKNQEVSTGTFIVLLLVLAFIIHPLGFFIYVSSNWRMANDGQFIFAVFTPFPYTSFAFVILGVLTDVVRSLAPLTIVETETLDEVESTNIPRADNAEPSENLIAIYLSHYKSKSTEELTNIISNSSWLNEAKIAAQRTLDERKKISDKDAN